MIDDNQPPQISWIHKPANRYALLMFVWVISILATIVISEAKINKLAGLALASAPVLILFVALEFFSPNKEILESLDEEALCELNSAYKDECRKVSWFIMAIVALTTLAFITLIVVGGRANRKKRIEPVHQEMLVESLNEMKMKADKMLPDHTAELEQGCAEILRLNGVCRDESCKRVVATCKKRLATKNAD